MKTYFQGKWKAAWIALLLATVVSINGRGGNAGLSGGSPGLYAVEAVPDRSGGFYRNQEADAGLYRPDDDGAYLRAGGTENPDDGGNASKLPANDHWGTVALCLLVYGVAKKRGSRTESGNLASNTVVGSVVKSCVYK